MNCSMPGFSVLHYLPELAETHVHVHWGSDAIQPSHSLLSSSPALNLSQHQGLFQWDGSSHQEAKILEFHFHLLQHHSSKASILQHSAFFMVQLSTTGKTIALTIWTFVSKVMSLLFNMLSRFVIVFLPRSKWFLFLCLQSSFAVILEPKKIKSVTVSNFSPSICHEVMGSDAMIFNFLNFAF